MTVMESHHQMNGMEPIAVLLMILILVAVAVVVGWVLPITLGVRAAKRKNYSPLWMLFGIHPIFGWIACIVLLCITPRIQCPNCGGFVTVNYRICPFCHAGLALPLNSASQPPPSQ